MEFEHLGDRIRRVGLVFSENQLINTHCDKAKGVSRPCGFSYNSVGIFDLGEEGFICVGHVDSPGDSWESAGKDLISFLAGISSFAPDPDKSYAENLIQWVKYYDIKIGDKVKVTRPFKSRELGCEEVTHKEKTEAVGSVFEVVRCDKWMAVQGLRNNCFPYFVLEPVK